MTSRSHLLDNDGFNQLARVKDGYYLYNRHDTYIGKAIEKYGEFSAVEMQLLTRLCTQDDFIIEVGANIGGHTVALARHVGPGGAVLTFEPQRLVFQALCANVAINSLRNVHCFWAAAGAEESRINVPELDPTQDNNFGGLSLSGSLPGQSVACLVLDGLLSIPRLKLIKIDVEGMETDVIAGGGELIRKFKPLLYVENDRPEKSAALMRQIDALGYDMHWHMPPLYNPDNFYNDQENIYGRIVSVNMICIHRENRVFDAPSAPIRDFSLHPTRKPAHTGPAQKG
jgi:FkbM family methyltransferase